MIDIWRIYLDVVALKNRWVLQFCSQSSISVAGFKENNLSLKVWKSHALACIASTLTAGFWYECLSSFIDIIYDKITYIYILCMLYYMLFHLPHVYIYTNFSKVHCMHLWAGPGLVGRFDQDVMDATSARRHAVDESSRKTAMGGVKPTSRGGYEVENQRNFAVIWQCVKTLYPWWTSK
jgi:hypothetical protein